MCLIMVQFCATILDCSWYSLDWTTFQAIFRIIYWHIAIFFVSNTDQKIILWMNPQMLGWCVWWLVDSIIHSIIPWVVRSFWRPRQVAFVLLWRCSPIRHLIRWVGFCPCFIYRSSKWFLRFRWVYFLFCVFPFPRSKRVIMILN